MNLIDRIDSLINDWENGPDVYNSAPAPADSDPNLCLNCGHFHDGDCPDPGAPCGSYLCCIN